MPNLMLPGNPRYQPKQLIDAFGYDNLMHTVYDVELAGVDVLGEIGVIPEHDIRLLLPDTRAKVYQITTTQVDAYERAVTKHDVRAAVHEMQEILPTPLRRWVHVPYTSYDALDTGRSLQFVRAQKQAVAPALHQAIKQMGQFTKDFADQIQIGRTHGQHALPITVGFWFATILSRILANDKELKLRAAQLVGKISGAVGAYNAQIHLGISARCGSKSFEERVLEKLGLKAPAISTQIIPPEPLAHYLFTVLLQTAAFAQLGRDCRHLMRTEIGEVAEGFSKRQSGSSTMAHKRNPINFEQLEGMLKKNIGEFVKVLLTFISEHQRDLTDSAVFRDFPILVVNLSNQLNALLRVDEETKLTFLQRIRVDREACWRNFQQSAHVILAEPLYIALQMAGYEGDAHELVNHTLMPQAQSSGKMLIEVAEEQAAEDQALSQALDGIPEDVKRLLHNPKDYVGKSEEQARKIAIWADVHTEAA
jgi:adenylosuccinate lyase